MYEPRQLTYQPATQPIDVPPDPSILDTSEVVKLCQSRADIAPHAYLVGAWVWAEFPGKPSDDVRAFLKQVGFRWNRERKAWQHPCGVFRRKMRAGDPRAYYGMAALKEEN